MKEKESNHLPHKESHTANLDHNRRPYWKSAHQDWRFWIGVVLMLIAISIYIMSDDFSIQPRVVESGH